jgi:phosphoribosylanthranilate isomerase
MWVKICGLTDEESVAAALEAGADALGFVMAPSVRQLAPAAAAKIAASARGRVPCIAVTLHPQAKELERIVAEFAPDVLQIDLEDQRHHEALITMPCLPVIRGHAVGFNPAHADKWPARVLFEGAISGAGELADWHQAKQLAQQTELILAGGLNEQNVATAIRVVCPFGVDVSSGVESAPGRKSATKIFEFVRAAKAAGQELS